jgi:hypothetical protein
MILSKYIIGILLAAALLVSCNRVTVIVEEIPPNTPLGEDIYIVGNFNDWSPGNINYQLKLNSDSSYSYSIPAGYGNLAFKFTRGNWTNVEKNLCGDEIEDRAFYIDKDTTLRLSIESWSDLDPVNCPERTIRIDLVPTNTPENADIAIASELNSWSPDLNSIAQRNEDGAYYLSFQRPPGINRIEFKVTRGDLSNMESDVFGNEIPNRVLEFGKKDTLNISVEGWIDMPQEHPERVTLILNSIPEITSKTDSIYFSSSLNSWQSGDDDYRFKINEIGQYYIHLPRKNTSINYKITRDGWQTVEVDKFGYDIENRTINLRRPDSVFIDVIRWKDQDLMSGKSTTLILKGIPASTPEDEAIFVAGNFNNWHPGRLSYRFKKSAKGDYYLNIPTKKGDMEFKFTRGKWEQEAISKDGSSTPLYRFRYKNLDTLFINQPLEEWKDLPPNPNAKSVTIVINSIPKRTPKNSELYLASNINDWEPDDFSYQMKTLPNGKFYFTVPKSDVFFEYKITRGGWNKVETDKFGNDIENRIQYFGFSDTVYIEVERWRDY